MNCSTVEAEFAIIITIMVLELKVPHGADLAALQPLLPVLLSYVLSFIYVGIYWNKLQYWNYPQCPVVPRCVPGQIACYHQMTIRIVIGRNHADIYCGSGQSPAEPIDWDGRNRRGRHNYQTRPTGGASRSKLSASSTTSKPCPIARKIAGTNSACR
jgi:hypothetical protein